MNPHGPRARAGSLRLRLRDPGGEAGDKLAAKALALARELMAVDERSAAGYLLAAEVRMHARHGELHDPERAVRLARDGLEVEQPKPRASTYETAARAMLGAGDAKSAAELVREGLGRYARNPALAELSERIAEAIEKGE